jgi:undecaprenyl-diphosphatase
MDFMDLVCPVLRTPFIEFCMAVAGYFGHGVVGSLACLFLLAHGYVAGNQRSKRTGIALLVALTVAGLVAELLKRVTQLPRPYSPSSYGFPSGHSAAAFALASVLTVVFPAMGPVFYLLADLTALSRLYFRANFTWDIAGGAIVGVLAGIPAARRLIGRPSTLGFGRVQFLGWLGVVFLLAGGLVFYSVVEKSIRKHLVSPNPGNSRPAIVTLDFGTALARSHLRYGWSMDEQWLAGKQSVVWAQGRGSELLVGLPAVQDYRLRLRVLPYAPKGTACQRVEVKINDTPVAKILLERGWQFYQFNVPKTAIVPSKNNVQFFYDYAESPKSRGRSDDERLLSVAFDTLEVFPAH